MNSSIGLKVHELLQEAHSVLACYLIERSYQWLCLDQQKFISFVQASVVWGVAMSLSLKNALRLYQESLHLISPSLKAAVAL